MNTKALKYVFALALASASALATAQFPPPSAMDNYYATAREEAEGLPTHTVYRPLDLKEFRPRSLPVILWANGSCRRSNLPYATTLMSVASHGFVVVAVGAPDAPSTASSPLNPAGLTNALDWLSRENADVKSQFHNRLDLSKIGLAGFSCGGLEALTVASDPRVKSLAAVNTGFFTAPTNGYGREQLVELTLPTLIVNGGPTDQAYVPSQENFALLNANVPAYLASNAVAGHQGLWWGLRSGAANPSMQEEGIKLLVNWFDYTLNLNPTAGQYFFGAGCGLCSNADWTVQSKNW